MTKIVVPALLTQELTEEQLEDIPDEAVATDFTPLLKGILSKVNLHRTGE